MGLGDGGAAKQNRAASHIAPAPYRGHYQDGHADGPCEDIHHWETGTRRYADPIRQGHVSHLDDREHHDDARDDRRAQETREYSDEAESANRHTQHAPDQLDHEKRYVGVAATFILHGALH